MRVSTILSISSAIAVAIAQPYAYGQRKYFVISNYGLTNETIDANVAASESVAPSVAAPTTLKTSVVPSPTSTSGFTSYATANGSVFTINGKTGYFMGTNSYWIGFLTNNADVDQVMSHLAAVCQPQQTTSHSFTKICSLA